MQSSLEVSLQDVRSCLSSYQMCHEVVFVDMFLLVGVELAVLRRG